MSCLLKHYSFSKKIFYKVNPKTISGAFFSFMYHRLRSNTCILNLTSSLSDLKSLKIRLTKFQICEEMTRRCLTQQFYFPLTSILG